MKPGKLSQLLEKIRDAIPDLDEVDEKGNEILDGLRSDIASLLDQGEDGQADRSILDRMKYAVEHFEVTHPTLTAMISEASSILSNAGI